ncbi:hypothetical protein S40293_10966 [Stachybotrys chartarum IBT 40293]|nr:hypothetical protein S40293_10966 [Stachybotrys chartarum IBT 40293]
MKRSSEEAGCEEAVPESSPEVRLIAVNESKTTYDGNVFEIKYIQQLQNLYERFWIFDEIWPSIPLVDVCLCKISALLAEVRYFKQGWGPFGPETTAGKKLRQLKDDIELLRLILKNLRKFRPMFWFVGAASALIIVSSSAWTRMGVGGILQVPGHFLVLFFYIVCKPVRIISSPMSLVLLSDFDSDGNFNTHPWFATPPHYPLTIRITSNMDTGKRHLDFNKTAKSTALAPLKKLRVTNTNDSGTTGSPEHEVKINPGFLQRIMELMVDLCHLQDYLFEHDDPQYLTETMLLSNDWAEKGLANIDMPFGEASAGAQMMLAQKAKLERFEAIANEKRWLLIADGKEHSVEFEQDLPRTVAGPFYRVEDEAKEFPDGLPQGILRRRSSCLGNRGIYAEGIVGIRQCDSRRHHHVRMALRIEKGILPSGKDRQGFLFHEALSGS